MQGSSGPSRLADLLESWAPVDGRATRQDWIQHWSAWIGPLDAIALSGALSEVRATVHAPPARPGTKGTDLGEAYRLLRNDLLALICTPPVPQSRGIARPLPVVPGAAVVAVEEDFGSYKQRYLDIERRMEWRLGPFRQHCREVLTHTSTRLSQLARLDAALEDMLGLRSESLLARLPGVLERRFMQHRDKGSAASAFEQDFQAAMVAELDFRLEPVAGLVEAWRTGS